VRFCSMYRGENNNTRVKETLVSALVISLVSGLLAAGVLCVFSRKICQEFFDKPELTLALRVCALAIPFYILMTITTSFAQSFRRVDLQQGVANVFWPLTNFVLVGIAFGVGFRLSGAVAGFLLSGILSMGLGFYCLWRIFPEIKITPVKLHNTKQLLRFSLPTLFIGISYMLLTHTDRMMLGYFGNASQVGIYSAASVISKQMILILACFLSIFSPIITHLYNFKMHETLNRLFKTITRWGLMLSLPFFFLVIIFSNAIMMMYGQAFIAGSTVLVILAVAQLVNISTGPVGLLLQMTGKQDIEFFNGLILLIINISLNLWLIPIYGNIGAAIATGVSLGLIHIARLLEVYLLLRLSPYDKRYLKVVWACVPALAITVTVYLFSQVQNWYFLTASAVVLLLSYVFMLWLTGLDNDDKMLLSMVNKKVAEYLGRFK